MDEKAEYELRVNTFLLKGKQIEVGKIYEFLGEIEEEEKTETDIENTTNGHTEQKDVLKYILLKAKVLKECVGFHKAVYGGTSMQVNNLIECIFARAS